MHGLELLSRRLSHAVHDAAAAVGSRLTHAPPFLAHPVLGIHHLHRWLLLLAVSNTWGSSCHHLWLLWERGEGGGRGILRLLLLLLRRVVLLLLLLRLWGGPVSAGGYMRGA